MNTDDDWSHRLCADRIERFAKKPFIGGTPRQHAISYHTLEAFKQGVVMYADGKAMDIRIPCKIPSYHIATTCDAIEKVLMEEIFPKVNVSHESHPRIYEYYIQGRMEPRACTSIQCGIPLRMDYHLANRLLQAEALTKHQYQHVGRIPPPGDRIGDPSYRGPRYYSEELIYGVHDCGCSGGVIVAVQRVSEGWEKKRQQITIK